MFDPEKHVWNSRDGSIEDSLELLSTGFWSFDIESKISKWSPSLYFLLGREVGDYPSGEEGGLSLIHPDDRSYVHHQMSLCLSSSSYRLEYFCRMQHEDGRWLTFLCKGNLKLGQDGKPSHIFGFLTLSNLINKALLGDKSIASLNSADEVFANLTVGQTSHLNESDYRLNMALTHSGLGVFDWDLRSDRLIWNSRHQYLWGLEEGEFSGYISDFSNGIHPDDLSSVIKCLNQAREQKTAFNYRFRNIWPDKSQHWIESRGEFTYGRDGQALRMFGTVADVTSQQEAHIQLIQSEERFRDLFVNLPIAYQVLDDHGRWLGANQAMADLLGYKCPDELIGQDFLGHIDGGVSLDSVSVLEALLGSGSYDFAELNLRTKRGQQIVVQMSCRSQQHQDVTFIKKHCVLIDTTERNRLHRATQDLNRELEVEVDRRTKDLAELLSKRSQFLAHMSHEIRNPMNIIGISTHLLAKSTLDDLQRGAVDRMTRASVKLMRFVDEILDHAKLESGEVFIDLKPFELEGFLNSLHDNHETSFQAKGVCFTVQNHAKLTYVVGDERRIGQVMDNLVSNAMKCTPDGGSVSVKVTSRELTPHHDELLFEVIDSGCGIAQGQRQDLFQPFKQLGSHSDKCLAGTGLGLSISKGLVTLMGGEIDFDSTPGKGSRFWFLLPITNEDNQIIG